MSSVAKRLSWALALSLGLNLFLLGLGSARWLHRRASYADEAMHHDRPHLPRFLGPPTPELREQHEALRAARRKVGSALEAEPYDPRALSEALVELRAITSRGQELLHAHLLAHAAKLSAAERRALAESRFLRAPWSDERQRGRE